MDVRFFSLGIIVAMSPMNMDQKVALFVGLAEENNQ